MNIQKTFRRLTPAAWIAVAGTVAGVIAFGWFVAQMRHEQAPPLGRVTTA